jgi:hypothetical protein
VSRSASATCSTAVSVEPPAEDASRSKEALLFEPQQVEALGDRVAERALPFGQVARASSQRRQPPLKPSRTCASESTLTRAAASVGGRSDPRRNVPPP